MNTGITTTVLTLLVAATSIWAEGAYPVAWSRQLGTGSTDNSQSVAVDDAGNAYIGGFTYGSLDGANAGLGDAFLAKYDSAGTWQWTRQLGTATNDRGNSVAVDGMGNAFISGYTGGPNNLDAFLAKYDSAGTWQWTRELGTAADDSGNSVAVDGAGNAYISGATYGSLGGPSAGGHDAFLAKYDTAGNLLWTEQLGTADKDNSYSVAVDSAGNAFISGYTTGSLDGPNAGYSDAFVAKYDSTGTWQWTQQLGSAGNDQSNSVAVDSAGNVYISGETGGFTPYSRRDAFLAKYDAAGAWLWTRELGTTGINVSYSVAVDHADNAYISGWTTGSLDGPNAGASDAFLAKYDSGGNLLWVQQLGTTTWDSSSSVAVDGGGNVFISGETQGSLGGPNAGGADAFLVKYEVPEPASAALVLAGGAAALLKRRRRET